MKIHSVLSATNGKSLSEVIMDITGIGGGTVISDPAPIPFAPGIRWLSGKIAKTAMNVAQFLGDDATNSMLDKFKNLLTDFLRCILSRNGITAKITADKIIKEGDTMKIDLSVTDIDYVSIVKKFLPVLLEKNVGEKNGLISEIVGIIGDERDTVISAVLAAVSDEKKEKIIGTIVEEYQISVCKKLTDLLKKQDIDLEVKSLSIETENNEGN